MSVQTSKSKVPLTIGLATALLISLVMVIAITSIVIVVCIVHSAKKHPCKLIILHACIIKTQIFYIMLYILNFTYYLQSIYNIQTLHLYVFVTRCYKNSSVYKSRDGRGNLIGLTNIIACNNDIYSHNDAVITKFHRHTLVVDIGVTNEIELAL